jgi:tyrosyl-DNA phosphodiesterase 2
VLSYNVWFNAVALVERMAAIGSIVSIHDPDVICFQEVTPTILRLFASAAWWGRYADTIMSYFY